MKKLKVIANEGSKKLYSTDRSDQVVHVFLDELVRSRVTSKIPGRAEANNLVSTLLFDYLQGYDVPTHFIRKLNAREMVVKPLEPIPFDVMVRNIASGPLCQRFKIKEGTPLSYPITEFLYMDSGREPTLINEHHAFAFKLATPEEVRSIGRIASKVNAVLKAFFQRRRLELLELCVQFGRYKDRVLLGDDLSMDRLHVRDTATDVHYVLPDEKVDTRKLSRLYGEFMQRVQR